MQSLSIWTGHGHPGKEPQILRLQIIGSSYLISTGEQKRSQCHECIRDIPVLDKCHKNKTVLSMVYSEHPNHLSMAQTTPGIVIPWACSRLDQKSKAMTLKNYTPDISRKVCLSSGNFTISYQLGCVTINQRQKCNHLIWGFCNAKSLGCKITPN